MTRLFRFLGARVIRFFTETYHMYVYFLRCVGEFRHVYFYRRQVVEQCYTVGVGSLSLVCLVSAFSGMAVALQMGYQMEAYVPEYMVGSVVVRSVVLELAPVVDQLGSLFRFAEYRVVGRANAMAMEGASMVISSNEDDSSDYEFEAACGDIGYFDGIVRLGELSIAIQEPVARYLNASVNVRDGDIAILGASHGDPRQGSLITVVTARVVD